METVLSSPKYRRLVAKAHTRGFAVKMIYVTLGSADLQLRRIRQRVLDGGHDVPANKVIDRRHRSFAELAWFARHVDQCTIFENSVGDPELAATMSGGSMVQFSALPADLVAALREGGVELIDAQ